MPDAYHLSVKAAGRIYRSESLLKIPAQDLNAALTLNSDATLVLSVQQEKAAGGGEELTSKSVSEIPLNKRDLSQLLLLAAGTATDSSGAFNFTPQFAINGQRGVEATFAMDGADITDPEMGGGTFTNFNVDAIRNCIDSTLRRMPAEVGQGCGWFYQYSYPLRRERTPWLVL